jgi:hypothetical protein
MANLGNFWSVLQRKMSVNFMAILSILLPFWYTLWPFGIFYGHLVYFMAIWYILWPFGVFYGHLVYFCGHFGIVFPF